ncbi:MAG: response regulator [Chitinophagaceae bacterium]
MKKCILLYDDDIEILIVCKIILEKEGYRVETRIICDNILDDIIHVKPDLILMDLWIPEIGGEKATKLMKENKATQHIPIVLFSANAETEEIYRRTNASGFLKKPFDLEDLLNIVKNNILVIS